MVEMSAHWRSCASPPGGFYGNIERWSFNEFVVASNPVITSAQDGSSGIYKYNAIKDEWDLFIKYPKKSRHLKNLGLQCIASDPNRQRLYISEGKTLIVCDTPTQRTLVKRYNTNLEYCTTRMVTADRMLHDVTFTKEYSSIQVTQEQSTHSIWNGSVGGESDIERVSGFDAFVQNSGCSVMQKASWRNAGEISLLHVPSQNIILLIGGPPLMAMWKYHIDTKLWISTGIAVPDLQLTSVLTPSENQVIIGAVTRFGQGRKLLYILDIQDPEQYKLQRCSIECPQQGTINNFILSVTRGGIQSELLVIG